MIKKAFLLVVIAVSVTKVSAQSLPAELIRYADMVLHNGKVLTADRNFTIAEAVAVRDGKILAVGLSADILRLAGPDTRRIDLRGKSAVPGFIDSDADNDFGGEDLYKRTMVNGKLERVVRAKDIPTMLQQVRQLVAQAKPDSMVFVRMADEFRSRLHYLTAKHLDEIAPANPLVLFLSSSEGVANSRMLERAFAAGLRKEHFQVVKDNSGKPTGQLFGQALGFIGWNLREWPQIDEESLAEQEWALGEFLRVGVTTLTGHASGWSGTLVAQLFHQDRLKIRTRLDLDFSRQNPMADQILRRVPNLINFGLGDGMLRIRGAAIGPVDGGSDDGGILTHAPKQRVHPEVGGGPRGRNKWTGAEWTGKQWEDLTAAEKLDTEWRTILLLRKHGWNIGGNHNMGSAAATAIMETLLDADQQPDIKVAKLLGRNTLDHNLIWDTKSIEMAKQLGDRIAFGLNSELWSPRTVEGVEMLSYQYGEGMHTLQPVKELLQAGLNLHLEGGKPGEPPLWRIERFVTRTEGAAKGSKRASEKGRVWGKAQAIDRKQALWMVTLNAAKFISEDNMLGSIEKGKYADLVVLSGDYMTVPDEKIDDLEVVMTIVNGKVAYESPIK
jgi:predicted amidohydrolase YtcJ